MDELILEYLQDLQAVADAEDDRFPEFLFTYLSQDFGDNYYERGMADTPLLREAKKIRRKYNDFFDFCDAMEVYKEYMELLAEKYGSIKIVKESAKEGMIDEYVPPKPKLKNTKRNRQLSAEGIVPSRKVVDNPDPEEIIRIARLTLPTADGSTLSDQELEKKVPKKYQKIFDAAYDRAAGANRKRNMYRHVGTNESIDFILNFINGANSGDYSTSSDADMIDKPLSEVRDEMLREREIPEELLEYYLTPNTRYIRNGRVVNHEDENKAEIMALLYEMGVDVFNSYGKNMNKTAVKLVRERVGDMGPMTKKERKRHKKQLKKERERMAHKRNNDAMLERTLLRNRFSFDGDGNAISMRMSDIIRD